MIGEFGLSVVDATLPIVSQQEIVRGIIRPHLGDAMRVEANPWRDVLASERLSGRYLDSLAGATTGGQP